MGLALIFDRFKDTIQDHPELKELVELGEVSKIEEYLAKKVFDKPEEYFTLKNLEKALQLDRKLNAMDILLYGFGFTDRIKSKQEYLEEEFEKFDNEHHPDDKDFNSVRYLFETYLIDAEVREIVDSGEYAKLNTNSSNLLAHFKALPEQLRDKVLLHIKNNVEIERFA